MLVVGLVVLGAGALSPDERFGALGFVLGAPTAALGALSLLYGRIAPHLAALRRQRQ